MSAGAPTLVIRPAAGWASLGLRELWHYRELLYFLTWRDVKVRYKQTLLGVAWAVLQPVASVVVFTLFFGRLAAMPSDGMPYALFSYAGVLIWTYVANGVSAAAGSLVGSANLITKVYFPRATIPASAALAGLVDYAIALALLVGLQVWYGFVPAAAILVGVALAGLAFLLVFGVGLWLSALNVLYRDVRHAVPFAVQLWMFASPIVYPLSLVPDRWRWLLALNPLVGIVEAMRASVAGRPLPWDVLAVSVGVVLMVLMSGALYFCRMERMFADVV